ncbi:hypothetical protein I4U23_017439 [Adineta vaga]|nr:hypothetical protein I4U23_017439 [Adineta vaga]
MAEESDQLSSSSDKISTLYGHQKLLIQLTQQVQSTIDEYDQNKINHEQLKSKIKSLNHAYIKNVEQM